MFKPYTELKFHWFKGAVKAVRITHLVLSPNEFIGTQFAKKFTPAPSKNPNICPNGPDVIGMMCEGEQAFRRIDYCGCLDGETCTGPAANDGFGALACARK